MHEPGLRPQLLGIDTLQEHLACMRQERRFQPGETISARHVAAWISQPIEPDRSRTGHIAGIVRALLP